MSLRSVYRKVLERCCPEWRKRLEKYVATGDLDEATSDHLDSCPTCTEAVEIILRHKKRKP